MKWGEMMTMQRLALILLTSICNCVASGSLADQTAAFQPNIALSAVSPNPKFEIVHPASASAVSETPTGDQYGVDVNNAADLELRSPGYSCGCEGCDPCDYCAICNQSGQYCNECYGGAVTTVVQVQTACNECQQYTTVYAPAPVTYYRTSTYRPPTTTYYYQQPTTVVVVYTTPAAPVYAGEYCSTLYETGPNLPTTAQGDCGTILILNGGPPGKAASLAAIMAALASMAGFVLSVWL